MDSLYILCTLLRIEGRVSMSTRTVAFFRVKWSGKSM